MDAHTIMEEREELMVAPGGGKPTLRSAHFLKPTDSPTPRNHSTPFPLSSNTIFKPASKPLKVSYHGWRMPRKHTQEVWENWVQKLQPVYGEIWKKAKISEAILASKSRILKRKNSNNLMINLAEKWCPDTSSFLFSWGETTLTLEDVTVLSGLPVLGHPVKNPMNSLEMAHLDDMLRAVHKKIFRNTRQPPRESTWMDHFNGGDDEDLEHEAFLVLWLSRYVFCHEKDDVVKKNLFLVAANLSRGIPFALAPPVLASIYRDLGCLRNASLMASKDLELSLCSPLGLVQVWAWERFPKLSPVPKSIGLGEPRLSRWNEVEPLGLSPGEISEILDSSEDDFLWRPYVRMLTNWDSKKLYTNEKEKYIMTGPEMNSETVQVLIRIWRNSELVGMDCVEQYLPHRVAMQFGFDQDVPEPVERLNFVGYDPTHEPAWRHFNRPFGDAKVYVPARMFESDVTKRYQKAWKIRALGSNQASGKHEMPPGFEDQLRPVKMEILSNVEDRIGLEKGSTPDVISVQERSKSCEDRIETGKVEIPEVIRVQEKSKSPVEHGDDAAVQNMAISSEKSCGSYAIEEVTAMVTNLEKLWATVKAKGGESAAKKMKRI